MRNNGLYNINDGFNYRYDYWLNNDMKDFSNKYDIPVDKLVGILEDFQNFKKIFEYYEIDKFIAKYLNDRR